MANKEAGVDIGVRLFAEVAGIKTELNKASKEFEAFKRKNEQQMNGLNKSFGSFDKTLNNFGNKITGQIKNLGAYAAGFIAIGGAAQLADKFINSTQFSADAFDKKLTQAKFSTDQFFIAVTSGDMSNLIQQLRDAAEAGGRYAETMDWLGDAQLAVTLRTKEANPELKKLEEIFRDKSGEFTLQEKQDALDKYKAKLKEVLNAQLILDQKSYDNELQNSAIVKSGLSGDDIIFVLKNYDLLTDKQEEANRNIEKFNSLITVEQSMYAGPGMASSYTEDKSAAIEYYNKLSEEEKKWFNIQKNYGKLNDENLKKLAEAWGKVFDTKTAINAVDTDAVKIQNYITNQTQKESEAAAKNKKEREAQLAIEKQIAQQKALNAEFKPLQSLIATSVTSSNGLEPPAISRAFKSDDADDFINKLKSLEIAGLSTADALKKLSESFSDKAISEGLDKIAAKEAILNDLSLILVDTAVQLGDQFGQMAAQGNVSFRTLLSTLVQTTTSTIIAYMIQSQAALAADSTKKLGIAGLALAAGMIAAAGGLFSGLLSRVPAAADGYIASGNSLVNVGEYPGASSDVEIGAPVSKFRQILGIDRNDSPNNNTIEMKLHLNTFRSGIIKTNKYYRKK